MRTLEKEAITLKQLKILGYGANREDGFQWKKRYSNIVDGIVGNKVKNPFAAGPGKDSALMKILSLTNPVERAKMTDADIDEISEALQSGSEDLNSPIARMFTPDGIKKYQDALEYGKSRIITDTVKSKVDGIKNFFGFGKSDSEVPGTSGAADYGSYKDWIPHTMDVRDWTGKQIGGAAVGTAGALATAYGLYSAFRNDDKDKPNKDKPKSRLSKVVQNKDVSSSGSGADKKKAKDLDEWSSIYNGVDY